MAIQIKVVERPLPRTGGNVRKFYASPVQDSEVTLDILTKAIEKTSTVSGIDIRAVIYAMLREAVAGLEDGKIVRFGEFGSLRITLHSEGKDTPDEITPASVKKTKILFSPGKELKEMQRNAKFVKI